MYHRGILRGRHAGNLFEAAGKILDIRISEYVRNLGKIHPAAADELLCG